jgi:glycosyltransferase involved in cell wall biosynthesis
MAKRIRVLLLIPHLGGGGAERVTALLLRGLSAAKYEVHLGLVAAAGVGRNAGLDVLAAVTVHDLRAGRVRNVAVPVLRLVWKLRPAVILSSMAHLNFLVLLLRPLFPRGTKVLVRQNGTVSAMVAADRRPWLAKLLYRRLYRRADQVICQTQSMADDLAMVLNLEVGQIAVLPNPIDVDAMRAAAEGSNLWTGAGPHLLAVGRLAPEKGFDLLLEAFAAVRRDFPDANLLIAGEGSARSALEEQARRLGLTVAVCFVGYVDQPWRFYPGATLFVLSSRHEGMPNALLEAAAAGLPIVATPASGGVVEFLGRTNGAWLSTSTSVEDLANALNAALRSIAPGKRFDRGELVQTRHGFAHAIAAYEALIDKSIEKTLAARRA